MRLLSVFLAMFFPVPVYLHAAVSSTETANVPLDTRASFGPSTGTATSSMTIVDTLDAQPEANAVIDTRERPALSAPTAFMVVTTNATLGAEVLNDGGAVILGRGIVYSRATTNADPMIGGDGVTQLAAAGTTGTFWFPISGLPVATGHVFKAYAINLKGTSYSPTAAFTTLTLHEGWRQTHFGIASGSGDAADDADPDRDGLKNLLEYAMNLPPNAASRMPASMQKADVTVEYTYTRGTAAYNGGMTFQVEWSDDLTTWFTTGVVESLISDDGTQQQVKATLPAGSGGGRFVRLRVQ
jgi:hypothetical protein